MSETVQNPTPPKKKRGRGCLTCFLILIITFLCLAGAIFLGPKLAGWLGIFGMEAQEAYEAAPDLAASDSQDSYLDGFAIVSSEYQHNPLNEYNDNERRYIH